MSRRCRPATASRWASSAASWRISEGENIEIRPFLGTSRLAMPIDHYRAEMVFHGHAHHGTREGKTRGVIPVYNVAMPLIAKHTPDQRFALLEL
jgi:hypothetical protein